VIKARNETWAQWMLGHRPLSRYFQIDRLIAKFAGKGTETLNGLKLPRGRYTVFLHVDPGDGVMSFALDSDGFRVFDEWLHWDGLGCPLVQAELPSDSYALTVATRHPTASWEVQVILNSLLSWGRPPAPWRSATAIPSTIALSKGSSREFVIPQTGAYDLDLVIDGFDRSAQRLPARFCDFNLGLRASDGHRLLLGGGEGKRMSWPITFLGEGQWTVEMQTECEWSLTIRPMIGPSGGGAQWF
jgi:hypothetical protein